VAGKWRARRLNKMHDARGERPPLRGRQLGLRRLLVAAAARPPAHSSADACAPGASGAHSGGQPGPGPSCAGCVSRALAQADAEVVGKIGILAHPPPHRTRPIYIYLHVDSSRPSFAGQRAGRAETAMRILLHVCGARRSASWARQQLMPLPPWEGEENSQISLVQQQRQLGSTTKTSCRCIDQ
jgi:hypothetical protein